MADATNNPYVGPRTFAERDGHLFFGREREARELLWMVMSEPLVLFYAQSGAGKSSLINTRLVPGLRQEGFQVLPIGRVGGELQEGITEVGTVFVFNLLLSLDQGGWASTAHISHCSLSDFLSGPATEGQRGVESDTHAGGQHGRVLIIDQFEELFTTHLERWGERQGFFRQLGQAMRRDPMLWVVLVMRQDYVAALDPHARLLPGKLRARFQMRRMGCPAALEAVTKPAAGHGRPFAPGVAESLVDNLRQVRVQEQAEPCLGEFIEPVQLQVACYQLWENLKARPPGEITGQDLHRLGDVDAALAQFYEAAIARVLAESGGSEIELRDWFGGRLITEAGTRGTVYQGPEQTGGLANQTVQLLVNQFLLRAEVRAGGTWYELVHDRFVEPIQSANEAWRWRQSRVVQAALAWDESGRGEEELYRGYQLQAALARLRGQQLEPLVAEFLDTSKELDQQLEEKKRLRALELEQARRLAEEAAARESVEVAARQEAEARAAVQAGASRRLGWLAIGMAAVFLVALAVAIFAVTQRQEAVEQEATAEAAQATAVAQKATAEAAQATAVAQKDTAEAAQATAVAQKDTAEAAQATAVAQKATAEAAQATAEAANSAASTAKAALAEARLDYQQTATEAASTAAVAAWKWSMAVATAGASTEVAAVFTDIATSTALNATLQAQLTAAAATANPTATPEPAHTPKPPGTPGPCIAEGRIVFTCFVDGFDQICTINADGSGEDEGPLTSEYATDWYASFSPDGREIVFSSRRDRSFELYIMDADGSDQTRLSEDLGSIFAPSLSSDDRIVFSANLDGNQRIWVADLIKGEEIRLREPTLLTHEERVDEDPVWSRDGTRIAFSSDKAGEERELHVMDADGSNRQVLAINSDIANKGGRTDWSPDGRSLAFYAGLRDSRHIYIADNVDKSDQETLDVRRLTSDGDNTAPSFSPDGEWITFARKPAPEEDQEIFIMRIDGTCLTQLTENERPDWQPRWGPSPEGEAQP